MSQMFLEKLKDRKASMHMPINHHQIFPNHRYLEQKQKEKSNQKSLENRMNKWAKSEFKIYG